MLKLFIQGKDNLTPTVLQPVGESGMTFPTSQFHWRASWGQTGQVARSPLFLAPNEMPPALKARDSIVDLLPWDVSPNECAPSQGSNNWQVNVQASSIHSSVYMRWSRLLCRHLPFAPSFEKKGQCPPAFTSLHSASCYCQQRQANIYFPSVCLKTDNLGINLGVLFVQIKYFSHPPPKGQLLKGFLFGIVWARPKAKWGRAGQAWWPWVKYGDTWEKGQDWLRTILIHFSLLRKSASKIKA